MDLFHRTELLLSPGKEHQAWLSSPRSFLSLGESRKELGSRGLGSVQLAPNQGGAGWRGGGIQKTVWNYLDLSNRNWLFEFSVYFARFQP